ncbi:class I SAM-dependent DNA methyltransferase [Paenibacillus alginolyticus]|uniref:Class I SAM-dependent methyltransferase n=1 Tax=Paenibacillus alginolyticus TaxID=59839 RepID=A0ABT4GI50_9BACL|nr:class I SAM-dependent methyltransferase [Paenibacillus alginolyticus]MCY9695830.1 class I SAM-dependent methyltransferase [Paenibacillus alginolyticus]MEC0143862.1 class I SAM-dependent methyltransferase [Paenibacillus alginolyticus]
MSYEKFAYTYDRLMNSMPYEDWLRFVKESFDRFGMKPSTIVDLGCGTGNLTIPLALEGYQLTGIDLSEDMLAVAEQKAGEHKSRLRGGSIHWVQQDLREWDLGEQVDVALSICDSLNYLLEEDDIIRAFRQTFEGLKPGGLFLFDVHTPEQLFAYADSQPFFLNEDDVAYIWTSELDEERVQIEHDLTIFVKDSGTDTFRRIDETHLQRAYSLQWLKQTLLDIGFTEVHMAADFTWEQPTSMTERAFFIAKK